VFASPGAIALRLGPLEIRWYGILMATAILVGFWIAHRRALRDGLPADEIIRTAQWAVVAGLVGARLYEVVFNWDYYGRYPWKIIAVWEGGLAMHGGLIVGPLVGALLAWRWGVPVLRSLDVIAPSMILGQAIGRWGNFFNEEAFGAPTDLPWKLYISPTHRPPEFRQVDFFHPTFLYESLWNLLVFVLLLKLNRRLWLRAPNGTVFSAYLTLYAFGRFWVESLRVDPAQYLFGVRFNLLLFGVVFLAAGCWFIWNLRRTRPLS